MGDEVAATVFTGEDRKRYREKVKRCLDVFARMLSEARFDSDRRSIGLEIELNITEETGDPALANQHVLEMIADPAWQTELAQFNIEINIPPATLEGGLFSDLENAVRASLNHAEEGAQKAHTRLLMVGILPTLSEDQLSGSVLTANPRYELLNEQIFAARGEDLHLAIDGVERLSVYADTIAPEAACTSVQLHQLVDPSKFANHWNAAQCIAGIQLAVGANSPFFFGRELWRETRIALFEQATDTRSEELKAQGVRPRVWFGERWITSIFDLFEENVRFFPSLLPVVEDEEPGGGHRARRHAAAAGAAAAQRHDLPLEPPDLRRRPGPPAPAGREPRAPGRPDGGRHAGQRRPLLRARARPGRRRPAAVDADVVLGRRGELPRGRARRHRRPRVLARHRRGAGRRSSCCASCSRWRTTGSSAGASTPPTATACSASWNAAASRNVTARMDGRHLPRLYDRLDRFDALREMTVRYREHMHSNEPVHTWPPTDARSPRCCYRPAGAQRSAFGCGESVAKHSSRRRPRRFKDLRRHKPTVCVRASTRCATATGSPALAQRTWNIGGRRTRAGT